MGNTYIGPYLQEEKLGKGYFGKSRLCQTADHFHVAAKIIQVLPGVDRDRVIAELMEFYRMLGEGKGRCPLVRFKGVVELEERKFAIISQFCSEGNLESRLHVRLQVGQLLLQMKQLAQDVEWLHQKGTPHGNLKPSNVLILNTHLHLAEPLLPTFPYSLRLRPIEGTCDYLSPEFHQGVISMAGDVWSLGVIFLEMFHCRRLRELQPLEGVLKPSLSNNYPSPALLAAVTLPDLQSLIACMLNSNPSQRIQIDEVVAQLQEMVNPELRTRRKVALMQQNLEQEQEDQRKRQLVPLVPTIDHKTPFMRHFNVTNNRVTRMDNDRTRLQVLSRDKIPLGMWLITVCIIDYGTDNDEVAIGFTTQERRNERMSGDIDQPGSLAYWSNKDNQKGNLCLNGEWMEQPLPYLKEGKGVLQMAVDTGQRTIDWHVDSEWVKQTPMPRNFWDQSIYFFMGLMGKQCTLQILGLSR